MNTLTKILVDEHQNILKIIDALIKECDALESGKDIDKNFFKKIIEFVREYADRFHHAKEEDILFTELSKDEVQMHCNPTQQMLYEHDLGRGFIKNMEDGLKGNNKDTVIMNARGYSQLLKEHIFKEDNILYPMAEEALDQAAQKEMLNKFEKVGKEFIKEKEKYISFIKELGKRTKINKK